MQLDRVRPSLSSIERLYAEYLEASDKAHRLNSDRSHVAQLERDICATLSHEPGGVIDVGNKRFALSVVNMGQGDDSKRLAYFRVTERIEKRNPATGGYSFSRRSTDLPDVVLPVAAPQRASIRRSRVAA